MFKLYKDHGYNGFLIKTVGMEIVPAEQFPDRLFLNFYGNLDTVPVGSCGRPTYVVAQVGMGSGPILPILKKKHRILKNKHRILEKPIGHQTCPSYQIRAEAIPFRPMLVHIIAMSVISWHCRHCYSVFSENPRWKIFRRALRAEKNPRVNPHFWTFQAILFFRSGISVFF